MNSGKVTLYVLNNYLKFEKKLYQIFGLRLTRPIRLKTIFYAIAIGVVEILIYVTPILNSLISWIPPGILIVAPFVLAWLLADVGTEDRLPINFFKSFLAYQFRKIKGGGIYRGREVQKEQDYAFANYLTYTHIPKMELKEIKEYNDSLQAQKMAIRYFDRIKNPNDFFKKEDERKKKFNLLSFLKRK